MLITQLHLTECYTHYIIYWPKGSVSSISASKAKPEKVAIGEKCEVTIGKKKYTGTVVARGKANYTQYNIWYNICILTGTKAEMDKMEDMFVTGEWIPPGIATPTAPTPTKRTTKCKRKCENSSKEGEKETRKKKKKSSGMQDRNKLHVT